MHTAILTHRNVVKMRSMQLSTLVTNKKRKNIAWKRNVHSETRFINSGGELLPNRGPFKPERSKRQRASRDDEIRKEERERDEMVGKRVKRYPTVC